MRILLFALALVASTAAAQGVRDALAVGNLICEFDGDGGSRLIADLVNAPRPARLLLAYEAVTSESAQLLSTEAPGRRAVLVRATPKAVHFIERVGPSVRVTTLTGCERRAWKGGRQTCVRYAARHAWHFDDRAASHPDRAFAQLPTGAAAGRCEPWQVE